MAVAVAAVGELAVAEEREPAADLRSARLDRPGTAALGTCGWCKRCRAARAVVAPGPEAVGRFRARGPTAYRLASCSGL